MERCPKCREEVTLVDPADEEWSLSVDDYEEDAEVWLCVACGWNEEADPDEAFEEHMANLDWIEGRLAAIAASNQERDPAMRPSDG